MAIQINKMIKIKQKYTACWHNYATGLLYAPTTTRCTRRDPSVYALRTTHLWYLCNKQILIDLEVPNFVDRIRALTKSFDFSWLVWGGPYFGQSEGFLPTEFAWDVTFGPMEISRSFSASRKKAAKSTRRIVLSTFRLSLMRLSMIILTCKANAGVQDGLRPVSPIAPVTEVSPKWLCPRLQMPSADSPPRTYYHFQHMYSVWSR